MQSPGRNPKTRVALSLDGDTLRRLDALVAEHQFASRSQAVETAVAEKLECLAHNRLAREAGKLDPTEEKAFAEEGMPDSPIVARLRGVLPTYTSTEDHRRHLGDKFGE